VITLCHEPKDTRVEPSLRPTKPRCPVLFGDTHGGSTLTPTRFPATPHLHHRVSRLAWLDARGGARRWYGYAIGAQRSFVRLGGVCNKILMTIQQLEVVDQFAAGAWSVRRSSNASNHHACGPPSRAGSTRTAGRPDVMHRQLQFLLRSVQTSPHHDRGRTARRRSPCLPGRLARRSRRRSGSFGGLNHSAAGVQGTLRTILPCRGPRTASA
jgi:hypothetical protein